MSNVYLIVNDGFKYKEFTLRITDVMEIAPSEINQREVMKFNYFNISMKNWWHGLTASFNNIVGDPPADIPDISEWHGGSLVFSRKAYDCLYALLEPHGEFLPVDCDGEIFFVFNCFTLALVDERNSEQNIMDGTFMGIKKIVFNPLDLPGKTIFKTKYDRCFSLYCGDELVQKVNDSGLTGIQFRTHLEDTL